MYAAVLIDLQGRLVRDIFWPGGYPDDTVTTLIERDAHWTDIDIRLIGGERVSILYASSSVGETRNTGWRLKDSGLGGIFFGSAVILPLEDQGHDYSHFFYADCPFNADEISHHIEWVRFNNDFSSVCAEPVS